MTRDDRSGARVERLRAAYDALVAGDFEAALTEASDEIEWRNPADAVEPGVRRGKAEFRAALERLADMIVYEDMRIEETVERGESVVLRVRVVGHGRSSGAPVDASFGHLWTYEGGRARSLEWFTDPNHALAAAGVEEWPSGWRGGS